MDTKKHVKINKVYKNGNLTTDRQDILDQWYKDFLSLYSPSFEKNIGAEAEELIEIEQTVDTNEDLNKPISLVKVQMVIRKLPV